ncbi:putative long-chain-fatty-acid--CoA ligase [Gordonia polyisoprenivorans VH2]|uniref:Putative long-chain-fatty-acid--CoA ligase n=2 Tax=Gordonia TaxID=2053 RepID=H6N3Z7_GORPV|nr:AMP-dependent synthetase/ligase [Gordonia polyisoprenivorans]AFA74820.1 putative long-chain-fatty-acid--CoA ligase [Gordonia polyisoprenivorans VH2]
MKPISFTGPGLELPDPCSLYPMVAKVSSRGPDQLSLGDGRRRHSRAEVIAEVERVASALLHCGVGAGDRVAVLGRTGLDWAIIDLAVLAVGGVIVPIYPTSSAAQIAHIVADSGATAFFGETDDDLERLRVAGAGQPWLFAEVSAWKPTRHPELLERIGAVRADDLAMIVYTSGTTGAPKGAMITHRNMYASAANTVKQTEGIFDGVTALGLPLSHVFGQTILFACLLAGTTTHLFPGIPQLIAGLDSVRPDFLALVPYALEKMRKADNGTPSTDRWGSRLRFVISGGASLDESTARFFAQHGVTILNCYGMTEAATAVTVSAPSTNRIGTVGRPIPGTEVAIADDGEVLVRGANVSPGYWGSASVQRMVDSEKWLHTGDLGRIDDGYLQITGRRKEILVTSGGKNVAPTILEDRVRLHRLVSNCIAIGDGKPFVTALITLDTAAHERWCAATGSGPGLDDDDLRLELQQGVDDANSLVSRAEAIRGFLVVPGDFTAESGLLTSSLKLRRAAIEAAYSDAVDALYGTATGRTA